MIRPGPNCVVCEGESGAWPAVARSCPYHGTPLDPSVAQHRLCSSCARTHGLLAGSSDWGGMRVFRTCPEAPEFRVALELMREGA